MPQLEGSNSEKTLPTCKKAADLEQFVDSSCFSLQETVNIYSSGWCQSITVTLGKKMPTEDCVPSFPWMSRVLDWYFSFSQHVQIADENWLILHWQKTSLWDSLQGRKLKIKGWLCENTCSFLPFKKKQMLLHQTERSRLANRCLNVDRLGFCRIYSLKDKKR